MSLWHMNSTILKGFYASDVFVSAHSLRGAVALAMLAYDDWLESYINEMGYHPLNAESDPASVDYASQAEATRINFRKEAEVTLTEKTGQAFLYVRN